MNRLLAVGMVWALLVIAWLVVHATYHKEQVLVAARELPENHLFLAGDVDLPGVTQRYLTRKVEKGAIFSATDTAPQMSISPRLAAVTVAVPLASVRDGIVDAGRTVRLCKGATQVAANVKVIGAICGRSSKDECTVILVPDVEPGKPSPSPPPADVTIGVGDACK